jgi:uncharacterized BrkB/YihY/UPF0761 family membrane protein/DNA-binding IscR family transcriptional regulator
MTKIKSLISFIQHDLWRIRHADLSPRRSFWLRMLRILVLSFREFDRDRCTLRASALTIYTLLSIVPMLAVAFGVAKGFNAEEALERTIRKVSMQAAQMPTTVVEAPEAGRAPATQDAQTTGTLTPLAEDSADDEVQEAAARVAEFAQKQLAIAGRIPSDSEGELGVVLFFPEPKPSEETTATLTADTGMSAQMEMIADRVIEFANKQLEQTKGGFMAGLSVVFLFWVVIKALGNIEDSFNNIWGVKRSRSLARKFSDYLAFMLISPFVFIIATGMTALATDQVQGFLVQLERNDAHVQVEQNEDQAQGLVAEPERSGLRGETEAPDGGNSGSITRARFIGEQVPAPEAEQGLRGPWGWIGYLVNVVLGLVQLALFCALLAFTYLFMPNTKVNLKSGILGGIVAGTLFLISQHIYVAFQIGVSKYAAVYGVFAALPLLLIWLQTSWLIVLYGAEFAFAHRNVDTYEFEPDCARVSTNFKRLVTLGAFQRSCRAFDKGEKAPSSQEIAEMLQAPIRLVNQVLYELVEARLLCEVRGDEERVLGYQPAVSIEEITVASVIERLDAHGADNIPIASSEQLTRLGDSLRSLREKAMRSEADLRIKDL